MVSAKSHIFIIPNPFSFKVEPPVFLAAAGQPYGIRNLTPHRVHVRFPDGVVQGGPDVWLERSGSSGDRQPFTTAADADGVYEYTVDVILTDTAALRATGQSNPRIIFD